MPRMAKIITDTAVNVKTAGENLESSASERALRPWFPRSSCCCAVSFAVTLGSRGEVDSLNKLLLSSGYVEFEAMF